jgi:hypothetical protein
MNDELHPSAVLLLMKKSQPVMWLNNSRGEGITISFQSNCIRLVRKQTSNRLISLGSSGEFDFHA